MTVLTVTTDSFENEILCANKSALMLFRGNEPRCLSKKHSHNKKSMTELVGISRDGTSYSLIMTSHAVEVSPALLFAASYRAKNRYAVCSQYSAPARRMGEGNAA